MNFMNQQQQQQQQQQQSNNLLTVQMNDGKEKKNNNFKTLHYDPFEVKHRKRTSRAQFKVLEKTFLENPKPNAAVRRWLAQKLSMTPRGVQVWFQNRRAKEKQKTQNVSPSPRPSVCACADCCFPMFDEEATTPITPSDSQSFLYDMSFFKQKMPIMNQWPFFDAPLYIKRNPMYTPTPDEFFHRLSEPVFDPSMTNFDTGFDLLPRSNSF